MRVAVRFGRPELVLGGGELRETESLPEIDVDEASLEPDGPERELGVEAVVDPVLEAAAPRTTSSHPSFRASGPKRSAMLRAISARSTSASSRSTRPRLTGAPGG